MKGQRKVDSYLPRSGTGELGGSLKKEPSTGLQRRGRRYNVDHRGGCAIFWPINENLDRVASAVARSGPRAATDPFY
jgi:hypothetical protein